MISKRIALKLMIGLLSLVLIFHLCVLFEIISYKIVWAGKLNSKEEMYVFEAVSILINFFLIIVLYIKFQNIKKSAKVDISLDVEQKSKMLMILQRVPNAQVLAG